MHRLFFVPPLVALSALFVTAPAAAGKSTALKDKTVIERGIVYGSTVSVEHGVRIIRPGTRERIVVVNPGRTPVTLNFSETNTYDRSSRNDGASRATASGNGNVRRIVPDTDFHVGQSYTPVPYYLRRPYLFPY